MNLKNSMVYHYCDLNAFLNIIKSRSLWMSDVKKSNDSMEGKYLAEKMLSVLQSMLDFGLADDENFSEESIFDLVDLINNYLKETDFRMYIPKGYTVESVQQMKEEIQQDLNKKNNRSVDIKNIPADVLDDIEKLFYDEMDPMGPGEEYKCDKFNNPIYASCFSENGDLLSQWRGYAADGTGVSIGFKKEYLREWSVTENPNFRCDFVPVKYNDSKIWNYAGENCKRLLNLIEKKDKYKQPRKIYTLGEIERSLRDILSYSPYYKQSSFEEEKEYRLICVNDVSIVDGMMYIDSNFSEIINNKVKNFKLSELKTRVVREGICSYYELSFMPVQNEIIGEIIIGPKSKVTTADIEYILSLYGYNQTDIESVYDQRCIYIRKSNLTYR